MHDFYRQTSMKRALPPLLALRAFEAAARRLSFTHAALELNVTQSAISRQVRALEEHLQRKLFIRLTRKIELTEEGQSFYEAIRKAFEQIEEASAIAIGRRARTVLTISVLPTVASLWLMPRLSSFWQSNRDIEVRIVVSTEPVDFQAQQVDMAIKVGPLPGKCYQAKQLELGIGGEMVKEWRGVQADMLFPDVLVPICSKHLLERGAPLKEHADLQWHTLIHTAIRRHAWRDWLSAHDVHFDTRKNAIDFGQYFMSLQAARDGEGVALIPSILVDSFDLNTELVRPFPTTLASAGEYYLLTQKARYEERAIKRFRQWILTQTAISTSGSTPSESVLN